MILTVSDFGVGSPYLGQMRASLRQHGTDSEVIDLVADLAPYQIQAAAHFLASQVHCFPEESIFLGVVDPDVGGDRLPMVLRADSQWFVGPENGLFDVVAARADQVEKWIIEWRPQELSATFHGRDLFAPVAAALSKGEECSQMLRSVPLHLGQAAGRELYQVIYVDCYGNLMSGIKATSLSCDRVLRVGNVQLHGATTFSDLPPGVPFWYQNSVGLVEIAVNQGSAYEQLQLDVGTKINEAR